MLGPIIADLAAWSYEHDRKQFYRQLIADGAEPSVYGRAYLGAASRNVVSVPEIDSEPEGAHYDISYMGQWLMWQVMGAFLMKDAPDGMPVFHCIEKEEGYARFFMRELITSLLHGATKSEAYNACVSFKQLSKTWEWRDYDTNRNDGILSHVFRAWDAFYRGFDFTSTIHNAVQCLGDSHLVAVLAGAFADAMYGCTYNYIKKKYAEGDMFWSFFNVAERLSPFGYPDHLIEKMQQQSFDQRLFFKKNDALTDVERHQWTSSTLSVSDYSLSEEQKVYLTKAWTTDWDRRYGLYLDDGWMYFYRSHVLICRFKFKQRGDGSYQITHLQDGDQGHSSSELLPLLKSISFRAANGFPL